MPRQFRAIEVLRTVESERRRATPEEQQTLVRYLGWGGFYKSRMQQQGGVTV